MGTGSSKQNPGRKFAPPGFVADKSRHRIISVSDTDFIPPIITMAYFARALISERTKPMYRNILLASVAAMALSGSAALAADLPSRAPPPVYLPPVPIFSWTGIYIGGQVGYAWASGNNNFTGFDPFFGPAGGTFLSSSAGGTPS